MRFGYIRVSTAGQARDGNSLAAQEAALREHGAERIYSDSASGRKAARPAFQELVAALQEGDTLIITKLDRMARSLTEGSEIIDELIARGVKVHILNIGMLDDTPASKLIRQIFLSFAEFEHSLITERMREGKTIARTKDGFKEGRPRKYTDEQISHALALLDTHTYREVERMMQISKSTLIRARRIK